MRAYADSSFIVRLVTGEKDSSEAVAEYRRLGRPFLFFSALHAVEVRSAILQRAFFQRRAMPSNERGDIARIRDAAFGRLKQLVARRAIRDARIEWESVFTRTESLADAHSESFGARSIDVLHVACALSLKTEQFITTDSRQRQIAEAEGLSVVSV